MSPLSPVVPVCPSRVIQHNTKQQHVHDYHPPQVQRLHKKTHGPLVKAFAFEVFLTITDFKGALMENATDKQCFFESAEKKMRRALDTYATRNLHTFEVWVVWRSASKSFFASFSAF